MANAPNNSGYEPVPLRSIREMFELKGRNYIVTGGAQGIGFAVATAICEMGGNVAVLDLQPKHPTRFEDVAKKFGTKVEYFQTDVSKEDSLRSSFSNAINALGSVDGLFAAAGIAIDKPFIDQTWAEAENIQKINLMGSFFSAQFAAKEMIKQGTGGSIVLVSSICAHVGLPGYRMSAYNASKGGIQMLSKALATEFGPSGIRVNTIAPAFTETEMTKVARDYNPQAADLMNTAPPLKRIGTPNDMMGAVVYLLSDASSYTTGTEILVTGGIHLGRATDYAPYA